MKVGVGITWKIVVDGQVDALNVDTTAEDISGNANSLVELFEFLVPLNSVQSLLVVA